MQADLLDLQGHKARRAKPAQLDSRGPQAQRDRKVRKDKREPPAQRGPKVCRGCKDRLVPLDRKDPRAPATADLLESRNLPKAAPLWFPPE